MRPSALELAREAERAVELAGRAARAAANDPTVIGALDEARRALWALSLRLVTKKPREGRERTGTR